MGLKKSSLLMLCVPFLVMTASAADHEHHGKDHKDHKEAPAATPTGDESLYNLKTDLLDVDGKKVSFDSLRGQPVVISMAYTSCAYACPLIIAQMQQLEKELELQKKKNVRFVLVSFDPTVDTPSVLKKYAEKRKLSSKWTLFTSSSDKAPREIANLLGVKYKKIEGGDYDHSFIITVLDSEGVIVGQQIGADKNPKDLAKLINN
ncbi:SCO family protein [Bdellovibrio sp.]|uniref:SCO family protein n=1 Tax=Bdellovibrio sp. TaxID=28201 RepID=UPI0039E4F8F9